MEDNVSVCHFSFEEESDLGSFLSSDISSDSPSLIRRNEKISSEHRLIEMYNSFIELKLNNIASPSVCAEICLIYTQWECKGVTLQAKI